MLKNNIKYKKIYLNFIKLFKYDRLIYNSFKYDSLIKF